MNLHSSNLETAALENKGRALLQQAAFREVIRDVFQDVEVRQPQELKTQVLQTLAQRLGSVGPILEYHVLIALSLLALPEFEILTCRGMEFTRGPHWNRLCVLEYWEPGEDVPAAG